jgi:uncharacterized protein
MKLVDANVLLYATNEESPQHEVAREWIEDALDGTEAVAFAWVVLLAFLRLSTNPRVFVNPLTPDQAATVISAWLDRPAALIVEPTERHLPVLTDLIRSAGRGGNLVTDAHLAALAIEHQAEVISFDSDFTKFAGVRWSAPVAPTTPDGPR